MKKRILSLALASAMAVGTVSGAFAETEVTKWANVPYVQGNEAGEFMPNSDITRQEIAVMIGKALELEGSNPDFKDADKIAAWASEFVAGLQDAEIVEGDDAGNFNPTNKITRAELATMVVRAYENATGEELSAGDASFDDVSDSAWYASAVKKAAEAGLVLGDGTGNFNPAGNATRAQTVVMVNRMLGLGEDNLPSNVAEVLETELNDSDEWPSWAVDAILVASTAFEYTVGEDGKIVIEGEEEDLAVESVSAINAKTLGVKFAKEPTADEKSGMTFTVKNGDSTVLTKLDSWDGATAQIVRTSTTAYDAGDYTVTVAGLEEGANNVGTVTVEAQKATTLEVKTSTLTDDTAKAKVELTYQDQYGSDLTAAAADFTATAYNKTQGKAVTVSFDPTDKYFYIDTQAVEANFKKDDVITVTVIHNSTGLKATKDLVVGSVAYLNTITLGDIQLPTGKTLLTADLKDVKVPYTAVDQYENSVTLVKDTNVTVVSSDESVLEASKVSFFKDTDGQTKLKVSEFKKAGKATVTLLSKASGNTATVTFDVQEASGAISSVAVAESSKTIAANSAGIIGLTVTDKYGNAIEAKDYVGKLSVSSSNQTVVKNADVSVLNTGEDYGKLSIKVDTAAPKDATATITITDTTTGKEYATVAVKAGEAVKPTAIDIASDSKHSTSLIVGATTNVKYEIKDQYGNKVSADDAGYEVVYTVKDSATAITESGGTDTDETTAAAAIAAAKSGSAILQAKLVKTSDGSIVDVEETTFNVSENNATGLTYSLSSFSPIVSDKAYANDGTSAYAQPVVVEAKDSNGNSVAIDPAQILSATIVNDSNSHIKISAAAIGTGATFVDSQEGKYVISASKAYDKDTVPTNAKVRVTLNTADGIKVLESEALTFAKDAPVAQELKIVNKKASIDDPTVLPAGTTDVTSITYANAAAAKTGTTNVFVNVKDQYGVWNTVAKDFIVNSPASVITLTDGAATDKFSTDVTGAFKLTDADSDVAFKGGAEIVMSAIDGIATDTLKVVITAETLVGATPNTTGTWTKGTLVKSENGNAIITFSEPISAASKTAVETAIKAGVAGVAGTDLKFVWSGTGSATIVTITNTNTTTDATFAADATVSNVEDLMGNVTTTVTLDLK